MLRTTSFCGPVHRQELADIAARTSLRTSLVRTRASENQSGLVCSGFPASDAGVPKLRLLANLLQKFIRNGHLRLYDSGGRLHVFGGQGPGPDVTARIHDRSLEIQLFLNPELAPPRPTWMAR